MFRLEPSCGYVELPLSDVSFLDGSLEFVAYDPENDDANYCGHNWIRLYRNSYLAMLPNSAPKISQLTII